MILGKDGHLTELRGINYGVDPAAIPPHGWSGSFKAGVMVNANTALQVDSVYTALRVITNAVIKMGNPRAYTVALDSSNEPYREWLATQPTILTSTFADLFQFDGQTRTVMSMALFGEAFWYVLTRDYLQRPSALEVLNPAFVEIKPDKQHPGRVEYFYGSGSQRRKLENENVIHIPFLAMPGAQRGLNSIEYAGIAYSLALAAMEYGQSWFANGASPSYLLSTEAKLEEPEIRRIAQRFMIDHAGLQNAHLPLVVDSGMTVQKIQSTPDESQYLGTLQYARMVIAAWFGLPSHLVGGTADKGNVWGKTVEEQGLQMVDYTMSGYIVRLNEAYSSLLARNTFAALNEREIISANSADTAAEILSLRTAAVETSNEIRVSRLRKAPMEGGDDLFAPLNSNATPQVGAEFAQEVADEAGLTEPDEPDDEEAA